MASVRDSERRLSLPHAEEIDARADVRVAHRAAAHWGVLSIDELRACGLSHDAVSVRVGNGRLHRMHRGVYAVGHARPALEGCFLAAVKACGARAVLSHFSAAAVWDLVKWDHRSPEVTVAGPATRVHPGLRVHRSGVLARQDVTSRRGIPVTSPSRTLVDLATVLDDRMLRRAVREAQALRLIDLRDLVALVARLGSRRGVARLRRLIATGPAPTRSVLEDVVLDLVLCDGLAHPDVNVPIVVAGRRVVPDFRWADRRLVIEADGAAWHEGELAREDDAERQALLEAHGERVLRVTWRQAIGRPRETLARLRAAGAPSAGRVSSHST